MKEKLRLATRKSNLALIQAEIVKNLLFENGQIESELIPLNTDGDTHLTQALRTFSQTGIFVKKLEEALLDQTADIAVHSLKDLPAPLDPRFSLPVFLKRNTANDILVSRYHKDMLKLKKLPLVIGTSSVRREKFLKPSYPAWQFKNIRGNLETRIDKLKLNENHPHLYDAIILSQAGLSHLMNYPHHLPPLIIEEIPTSIMVPAPGQGCIAVQCLTKHRLISKLHLINHSDTEKAVIAERKIMEVMGGGCHIPFGCQVVVKNNQVTLRAMKANLSNDQVQSVSIQGDYENIEKYISETVSRLSD